MRYYLNFPYPLIAVKNSEKKKILKNSVLWKWKTKQVSTVCMNASMISWLPRLTTVTLFSSTAVPVTLLYKRSFPRSLKCTAFLSLFSLLSPPRSRYLSLVLLTVLWAPKRNHFTEWFHDFMKDTWFNTVILWYQQIQKHLHSEWLNPPELLTLTVLTLSLRSSSLCHNFSTTFSWSDPEVWSQFCGFCLDFFWRSCKGRYICEKRSLTSP